MTSGTVQGACLGPTAITVEYPRDMSISNCQMGVSKGHAKHMIEHHKDYWWESQPRMQAEQSGIVLTIGHCNKKKKRKIKEGKGKIN